MFFKTSPSRELRKWSRMPFDVKIIELFETDWQIEIEYSDNNSEDGVGVKTFEFERNSIFALASSKGATVIVTMPTYKKG